MFEAWFMLFVYHGFIPWLFRNVTNMCCKQWGKVNSTFM